MRVSYIDITSRVGVLGERKAAQWLTRQGFSIVSCNWHVGSCEIDIVAAKDGVLHFVEVKTRRKEIAPHKVIDRRKARALLRAARCYLLAHNYVKEFSIDLVAVRYFPDRAQQIDYYPHVVEAIGGITAESLYPSAGEPAAWDMDKLSPLIGQVAYLWDRLSRLPGQTGLAGQGMQSIQAIQAREFDAEAMIRDALAYEMRRKPEHEKDGDAEWMEWFLNSLGRAILNVEDRRNAFRRLLERRLAKEEAKEGA